MSLDGAVLVLDADKALIGVLSERDIVNAIAEQGDACLRLSASDLMTREVVSCRSNDSVTQAMSLMTDLRIRHLPVIDDGTLTGVISIGDVVKDRITSLEQEAEAMRGYIMTG